MTVRSAGQGPLQLSTVTTLFPVCGLRLFTVIIVADIFIYFHLY